MKKIGEIKGVPVVEGDANLVKNQILYKETDKGISLSKRTNGKLEEVSGGSSSDNKDEGQWYKVVFKAHNPDTGEYMIDYFPLISDSDYSSVIFDRAVFYMAEYSNIGGDGHFCFYGDIPFDLSYKYIKYFDTFIYKTIVGVRLNPYAYDIVDCGTGVPLKNYINTIKQFEQHIDYIIENYGKYSNKKYDNKYLQYLHLCALASLVIATDYSINTYVYQTFYDKYKYPTIDKIFDKCEEYQDILLELPLVDEALFIEPTTKEELLQIAKERVENYVNSH